MRIGMTCIKCHRKVAKVFAIFVIDYTLEVIQETEETSFKTLQYTFYYLWGLTCPCLNNISN